MYVEITRLRARLLCTFEGPCYLDAISTKDNLKYRRYKNNAFEDRRLKRIATENGAHRSFCIAHPNYLHFIRLFLHVPYAID